MSAKSRKTDRLAVSEGAPAAASETAEIPLPAAKRREAPDCAAEESPAYWRRFYEE